MYYHLGVLKASQDFILVMKGEITPFQGLDFVECCRLFLLTVL